MFQKLRNAPCGEAEAGVGCGGVGVVSSPDLVAVSLITERILRILTATSLGTIATSSQLMLIGLLLASYFYY